VISRTANVLRVQDGRIRQIGKGEHGQKIVVVSAP
jgi:hypothetical protein